MLVKAHFQVKQARVLRALFVEPLQEREQVSVLDDTFGFEILQHQVGTAEPALVIVCVDCFKQILHLRKFTVSPAE